MQLGTRWALGTTPPASLPTAVLDAIRDTEAEVRGWAAAAPGRDASALRWTLTWLEGSPVVELDDGTSIRYSATTETAVVEAAAD